MPKIVAWIVSFSFVLVFWVAHHYFFGQLQKVDRGLLWLNGLFLLCISFTPFPTALVGDYPLSNSRWRKKETGKVLAALAAVQPRAKSSSG